MRGAAGLAACCIFEAQFGRSPQAQPGRQQVAPSRMIIARAIVTPRWRQSP
jgi:hypothetical protein